MIYSAVHFIHDGSPGDIAFGTVYQFDLPEGARFRATATDGTELSSGPGWDDATRLYLTLGDADAAVRRYSEARLGDATAVEPRALLTVLVVPCGRGKLDSQAPARQLYTGSHFRFALAAVEREAARITGAGGAARVSILSALHGLVHPDAVLAPYDVTMSDAGSITAERLAGQLANLGANIEMMAFLPKAYLSRLRAAASARAGRQSIAIRDAFASAPGIGYQRHILAALGRPEPPY